MEVKTEQIREFFKRDRLAGLLGMDIVEAEPGRAVVRMTVKDEHRNGVDMVHGGTIFSLADFAFAITSNSHGTVAVAIEAHIEFIRAARGDELIATGTEIARSRSLSTCNIDVTEPDGTLVARFTARAFCKDKSWVEML